MGDDQEQDRLPSLRGPMFLWLGLWRALEVRDEDGRRGVLAVERGAWSVESGDRPERPTKGRS